MQQRTCLKCRTQFQSEGPGNRLCTACRKKQARHRPAGRIAGKTRAGRSGSK